MYDLDSDRQVAKVSLSLSVMASIKYEGDSQNASSFKRGLCKPMGDVTPAAIMDFMVFTIIASIAVSLP